MKRFIAGAVCPECRATDRTVVEEHDGVRRRRCVSCGYCDTSGGASAVTPATRFSRRTGTGPTASSPVRIVDPRSDPKQRKR
jgi:uncharacterized protein